MQGSMRQRGDTWQLRVFAGRDPVTGRKRWVAKTVRGGKRVAQRELANLIAEVDRGLAVGTDATVNDLIARWMELASPEWSPSTLVQTRSAIRTHITPFLGPIKLKKLRPDLDHFYGELRKRPGRRSATLSPATIRRVYVILHAALEQAVKWGWIPVNPADASSPPKTRQAQIVSPAPEGVARLLAMVEDEDPEFFAYLRLAVNTGARRSQVCGLRWGDVDLSTGSVTFARAVVDGPDGIEVKGTKTDRVYRVTLDAGTLDTLVQHRQAMGARGDLCGVGWRVRLTSSRTHPTARHLGDPTASPPDGRSGVRRPGLTVCACTTFATSWSRPCSPLASRCPSSQVVSAMLAQRRPSTSTATSSTLGTRSPPTYWRRSWTRPGGRTEVADASRPWRYALSPWVRSERL